MATKTWKLGEVCQGGVITVETTSKEATIIAKEWDFTAGSRRSSNQSNAKEFNRLTVSNDESLQRNKLENFLTDLSTSYHADVILKWIESKTEVTNKGGW